MSGQARDGNMGFVHWTNDLTMHENSNDDHERVESAASSQSLQRASAGENVGAQSTISIQLLLNPVGLLQELCMARHFPFPDYTCSDENVEPEARFTVICSIATYKSSGRGMTKREAKKEAAYLMYKQIEKLTSKDFHYIIINNACEYNEETFNNMLRLCHESVTFLKTFFDSKDAPNIPHLQNINNHSNDFNLMTAIKTLKTISEKEGFTYKCSVISIHCDEVEVMMEVNTNPIIVASKSGKNEFDAKESAAFDVLTYFKLLHDI